MNSLKKLNVSRFEDAQYADLSQMDVGRALLTRLCQDADKKIQLMCGGPKKPWSKRSVNVINTCVNPMYI